MITNKLLVRAMYDAAKNPTVPQHRRIEYFAAVKEINKTNYAAMPEVVEALKRVLQHVEVAMYDTRPDITESARTALAKLEGGEG